jgi:NAD(P)-dependent dehydrogenase (short-subunit alcohol dehydrogenase family)
MEGKVVVVTGASGALGKIVVASALARGARIAGIDHAASTAGATRERIEFGGVDLTDSAQARNAIDAAASHFGKLDALINIAGGFAFETVAEGDPKTWQRMYALNVLTALNASRSAIPHLVASSGGRIVNVGAIGALQAGSGMGAYAASKAGVHRLTEALAAEWKGKITRPEELADVILFLASDAASAVTGALLPVNGRV